MKTPRFLVSIPAAALAIVLSALPAAAQPAVTAQVLPTLGAPLGIATAINNHGVIVGVSATAEGILRATLWTGGTATNLGALCEAKRIVKGTRALSEFRESEERRRSRVPAAIMTWPTSDEADRFLMRDTARRNPWPPSRSRLGAANRRGSPRSPRRSESRRRMRSEARRVARS